MRRVGTRAYVVLEDVARYEGLVHARVLVRLEVLQRVFGNTLMLRGLCIVYVSELFFAFSRGSLVAGVFTFARRHVRMGGGRWKRHEGLRGGFYECSAFVYLAIWRRVQLHAGVTSAAKSSPAVER